MMLTTCLLLALSDTPVATPAQREVEAVGAELVRGVSQLRLRNAPVPYWASARWTRRTQWQFDGAYGGLPENTMVERGQAVVEVRVGSLERDNTGLAGQSNAVGFTMPMQPDAGVTQHLVWRAMDQAFRGAVADYTSKAAILARLHEPSQGADHVAWPSQALSDQLRGKAQAELAKPCSAPSLDRAGLAQAVQQLSQRFANASDIDNGDVHLEIVHTCSAQIDSDERLQAEVALKATLAVRADTHAADGMHLDHARAIHWQSEIPDLATLVKDGGPLVDTVLAELQALARAPVIAEDYDGPVLLTAAAAAQMLASTVAQHASAEPSPLADSGRLVDLDPLWQRSLGKLALPDFLSIVDDPTRPGFGAYEHDSVGHAARRVVVVDHGKINELLVGGQPSAAGKVSNGHQRAALNLFDGVAISNLEVLPHRRGLSNAALERDLLRRAAEDGYDSAYIVEWLRDGNLSGSAPRASAQTYDGSNKMTLPLPALVYRLDAPGKRTLVRGVLLAPMSMRALRRIREIGQQSTTLALRIRPGFAGGLAFEGDANGLIMRSVDVEVKSPALLLDGGLELSVERGEQERPPVLIHPLRQAPPK